MTAEGITGACSNLEFQRVAKVGELREVNPETKRGKRNAKKSCQEKPRV